MREIDISNILASRLSSLGAIKWHKNKNHSFYIKFKDVRLGSIRIANHRGREQYNYTYEVFVTDSDVERRIEEIVEGVTRKAKSIPDFDAEKYIVFSRESKQYIEVDSFEEYKDIILKRKSV